MLHFIKEPAPCTTLSPPFLIFQIPPKFTSLPPLKSVFGSGRGGGSKLWPTCSDRFDFILIQNHYNIIYGYGMIENQSTLWTILPEANRSKKLNIFDQIANYSPNFHLYFLFPSFFFRHTLTWPRDTYW